MKKIGVISDTHITAGRGRLPAAVLEGFAGADLILHAGDLTHFSVLEELELIAPVKAVCGNCDIMRDANTNPGKRIVKVEKVSIGMIHNLGADPGAFYRHAKEEFGDRADCVVFGHTHKPHNEYRNGILLFNPGPARDKRSERRFSYGILEIAGNAIARNEIILF